MDQPIFIAKIAALIPARRQESQLGPLVDDLLIAGFGAVIVVDDGSPAADQPFFQSLASRDRVYLLHHATNLGKGRALKSGINYFLNRLPQFAGIVTADADGQHSLGDILRVANQLETSSGRAVLGTRDFRGTIPLRSRLGNFITSLIFHLFSGCRIGDTQTGLRAFPAALLPQLLALPGERYEYEMTVLAYLCRQGCIPVELPIATIYIDDNRSSSFNPIRDSMRIYFVLLRFYSSSLASAVFDFTGFTVTFALTRNVFWSVIVGRLSSLVNFLLNRTFVFHSKARLWVALWRYFLLAIAIAATSYGSIQALTIYWGWNVLAAKVVADTTLSLAAFSIQRVFVFPATPEQRIGL